MTDDSKIEIGNKTHYGKVRPRKKVTKITGVQKTPIIKRERGTRTTSKRTIESDTVEIFKKPKTIGTYKLTKKGIETKQGEPTQQEKITRAKLIGVLNKRIAQLKLEKAKQIEKLRRIRRK